MKTGEKGRTNALAFDLRVRDRQLANGTLDPKTLERHLAELTDLEAQADSLPFEQPALGGGSSGPSEGGRGNPSAGSA